MKEWCLQHPWMTFFIIIFIICIVSQNKKSVLGGKKENTSKINNEEVIKMLHDKSNIKQNGDDRNIEISHNSNRDYFNERGSQSVPPTLTSAPRKPPRQK
ncbi:hypothetical protein IRP63_14560 (plasmid) [Clostridium botulinum]|uniref:Uncharacterized protein n=2 Tax=Clostridium botulinum TaxID=1491 RepID=A0A9Q1UWR0_CLOBO|nr:hypothetical protein [Clostridium botulinum]AEB77334.1 hypothetical protein CbC4_4134 [Clostridium botulinum BKT015925]KEH96323.1 hypothetical protein Y848_13660 [Clostridium botulinum C/D str. Sp77]KEH96534.1 hypothetical protein Z953_p0113 [Clostridium botulinum D str. 16868]KGM93326.1 hypothetical protein Z955_15220 [Clostridium botulinum C/D str. DC5]KLU74426.1 hypothetical protein CBC3_p0131 [Clostridium botulinum V891]